MKTLLDLSFGQRGELATRLLACPALSSAAGRLQSVGQLSADLRNAINYAALGNANQEILNIIAACTNHPAGLNELYGVLKILDGATVQFAALTDYLIECGVFGFFEAELKAYIARTEEACSKYEEIYTVARKAQPGKRGRKPAAGGWRARSNYGDYLRSKEALPAYSPTPQPDADAPQISVCDFLAQNRWVALLGAPGAGKSTTLRWLFRQFAENSAELPPDLAGKIPLFAVLRRWEKGRSFVEFLQAQAPELANFLPQLLQTGQAVLLLDGLNELPDLGREPLTGKIADPRANELSNLRQSHPALTGSLTCRSIEFSDNPGWHDLHMLPLSDEQLQTFVAAFYAGEAAMQDGFLDALKLPQNRKLSETVRSQPFFLVRLLEHYGTLKDAGKADSEAFPANPALLLDYSVNEAYRRLEEENGLLYHDAITSQQLTEELAILLLDSVESSNSSRFIDIVFQHDKWSTLEAAGYSSYNSLRELLNERLGQPYLTHYYDLAEKARIVTRPNGECVFVHQLLQEFFVARYLMRLPMNEELLALTSVYYFIEPWKLYAGLKPDVIDELREFLKSPATEVRQNAVFALGATGDPAGLPDLIGATLDPDSDVRFSAVGIIAAFEDTRVVRPLLGALNDPEKDIQRYAAKLVGSLGKFAFEPLVQALDTKNEPTLRRYVVASILANFGKEAVPPLVVALDDDDILVKYEAVVALGKIGDATALAALQKLADELAQEAEPRYVFNRGYLNDAVSEALTAILLIVN
jgi:HEAT repeats/Effector-associated domain 2/NACHT domain